VRCVDELAPKTAWRSPAGSVLIDFGENIVGSLKELVTSAQLRAQEAASNAMVEMYWEIGSTILQRQAAQPWGTKVLQRLAADLKSAFPHMRGFSRSNLFYLRAFAAVWDLSDPSVRNRVNGLPRGHIIELLKLKDPVIRDWYAERAVEHKWRFPGAGARVLFWAGVEHQGAPDD
jgi:predicted nuclease of restriction endonuclease-like (RecB) superfamily